MRWDYLIPAFLAGVAATYPLSIFIVLWSDKKEARRWVQNSPSFCIFAIFILPLAAWLIVPDIVAFMQGMHGARGWVSGSILVVLLAIVVLGTRSEVRSKSHAGPFSGDRSQTATRLEKETEVRRRVREMLRRLDEEPDPESKKEIDQEIRAAKQEYFDQREQFDGLLDMIKRGTIADVSAYLVNLFCVAFAAFIVWHVFNVLALHAPSSGERLLLAVGLMVVWFPIRLYAEWYNNFFSMDTFNAYHVGIALIESAVVVYVMLIIKENPDAGAKAASIAITGLFGLGLTLGKVKPAILVGVADMIESTPFGWWLAYLSIALVGLGGTISPLLKSMGIS